MGFRQGAPTLDTIKVSSNCGDHWMCRYDCVIVWYMWCHHHQDKIKINIINSLSLLIPFSFKLLSVAIIFNNKILMYIRMYVQGMEECLHARSTVQ
jgi:hypothetical protein